MLLKDICVLDVATCVRDDGILAAAHLMRQHHTGDLVVIDNADDRVPVGIVTDRDIVLEVLGAELDPAATKVGRVMNPKLVIAGAAESVDDAVDRMRMHSVRRLPVVDHDGSLMGIVTLDDLLALHAARATALAEIVSKEQVREQRARR